MSVYTQLSLEQVQQFAQPYGLSIVDVQPIQGGIENTNYFLTADDQTQYVFTVFEVLDRDGAGELVPILQHLGQHGIPVPVPLSHHDSAIHYIVGKPAQIAPRLAGRHPHTTSVEQVRTMGETLAKMHVALQKLDLTRQNNHGRDWWDRTIDFLMPRLSLEDQDLLTQTVTEFRAMKDAHPALPCGLVHADLFRDNTLYVEDQLSAVLDFSELSNDRLLVDISITMNDFCSDFPEVALNWKKAQAFIQAYDAVRPLTTDEKYCLNGYLAMAACRFWLSRLEIEYRNQSAGHVGEDILTKDPQEMRLMLIDRLKKEYNWS